MKYSVGLVFILVLLSCSGGGESDEKSGDLTFTEKYFPSFPALHFQGIPLGNTTQLATKKLTDAGYTQKSADQYQWENKTDEIDVILNDGDLLYSFKVFFFSAEHISKAIDIKGLFDQHAVESSSSESFSVWNFDLISQQFKITMFEQPELLRLHYELKSAP